MDGGREGNFHLVFPSQEKCRNCVKHHIHKTVLIFVVRMLMRSETVPFDRYLRII